MGIVTMLLHTLLILPLFLTSYGMDGYIENCDDTCVSSCKPNWTEVESHCYLWYLLLGLLVIFYTCYLCYLLLVLLVTCVTCYFLYLLLVLLVIFYTCYLCYLLLVLLVLFALLVTCVICFLCYLRWTAI